MMFDDVIPEYILILAVCLYSGVGLDEEFLVKAPKKCQPTGDLGILLCQKHYYLKQGTLNTYESTQDFANHELLSHFHCRTPVPCPTFFYVPVLAVQGTMLAIMLAISESK